MPKISIIVPCYNAEKLISRCVDSVLAQEFRDFELFLMDDGSTDGTGALLDAYAEKDPRVRVVHKENSGAADTRNRAIDLAEGEYLQFLDADDWIAPEASRLFLDAAEKSGAGMVISDFYRVVKQRTSRKGSIDFDGLITRDEFAEWMANSPADYYYGVLWNKFFRRDIVEAHHLRMDRNMRWCEDFIFNLEYLLYVKDVYVLRVPLYYYVKTEGSLVQQGMKIGSIVRMKLSMIEYYTNFYKHIYSPADYDEKRLKLYSFLIDYSHDDAAIPLLPGTKRLGQERTAAAHEPRMENAWVYSYYLDRMLQRNLRIVAERQNLDEQEVKAILFLRVFGRIESLKELADYLGCTQVAAITCLSQLVLKGYLNMKAIRPELHDMLDAAAAAARLTPAAEPVLVSLKEAMRDVDEAVTDRFTDEEKETFRSLALRSLSNLRERLVR